MNMLVAVCNLESMPVPMVSWVLNILQSMESTWFRKNAELVSNVNSVLFPSWPIIFLFLLSRWFLDDLCFLIWSINVDKLAYNWESFKTYNFSSLDTEAEGSQDATGQTDLSREI